MLKKVTYGDVVYILDITDREKARIERAYAEYEKVQVLIHSNVKALKEGYDPDNGQ